LYSLSSQFRRAADSIVLNIAEGSGSNSNKEFQMFLNYATRSGFECRGCFDIALENGYITKEICNDSLNSLNEIIAMLDGLQKALRKEM
jgi:four helix bundle protein